jgi:signal transduction histidine kinase
MENINIPEANQLLSEPYLKALPASNPGLVCVIRLSDMKVMHVNEQFTYYLGYTSDDLHGETPPFSSLLEDYQYDHLIHQLHTVDNNIQARSAYVIYRLKGKNGNILPFYIYAAPLLPDDNAPDKLYFLLLLPDHSRWAMPFTSFESKELFLEQFESENFGTFEWIMEVNKIYFSTGLQQILEVANGRDINALTARSFVHPNEIERVSAAGREAIMTNKDLNIEFKVVTAKHNIKTVHCLTRLITSEDGTPVKFIGSVRDVTRHRAIEKDLKNKVAELNHSNKELEEFAYVASHDLQEPLRKITTFSDRLSEKYKDVLKGDGQLYLSRMTASAENMRRLINDLLEFSRVSKVTQPFEKTNLNVTLRQVKMELELVIEETSTVIHAAGLPTIEAISSQMKQLFANIISNAIKFRKPDVKPEITINAAQITDKDKLNYELAQQGKYYKIQITDNGIGFEDEYAARIFQVFQRLHGKSEYPGSGIGLAICKKIVEYHHGVIFAENIPGQGARFTFVLPEQQNPEDEKI